MPLCNFCNLCKWQLYPRLYGNPVPSIPLKLSKVFSWNFVHILNFIWWCAENDNHNHLFSSKELYPSVIFSLETSFPKITNLGRYFRWGIGRVGLLGWGWSMGGGVGWDICFCFKSKHLVWIKFSYAASRQRGGENLYIWSRSHG